MMTAVAAGAVHCPVELIWEVANLENYQPVAESTDSRRGTEDIEVKVPAA